MIDSERMALQAPNQSDGTGRVLGMDSREQMRRVRTCRRIPVILDWKDSDVGRMDPKELEMSDIATSMHSSRSNSAQGERSLEEKVKVSEASGRKQDSDERWVVPHGESKEAQRVESIENVGTENGKQDDEAIGRGEKVDTESGKQDDVAIGSRERAGTKGSVEHSENHDWEGIGDIVNGYEDTEVENEKEEKDIYHSVCALEDMPLMQRQDPELAEIITYLSTGDLPASV